MVIMERAVNLNTYQPKQASYRGYQIVPGQYYLQLHNTLMGRGDIIKETTLEVFNTEKSSVWNVMPMVSLNHVSK